MSNVAFVLVVGWDWNGVLDLDFGFVKNWRHGCGC